MGIVEKWVAAHQQGDASAQRRQWKEARAAWWLYSAIQRELETDIAGQDGDYYRSQAEAHLEKLREQYPLTSWQALFAQHKGAKRKTKTLASGAVAQWVKHERNDEAAFKKRLHELCAFLELRDAILREFLADMRHYSNGDYGLAKELTEQHLQKLYEQNPSSSWEALVADWKAATGKPTPRELEQSASSKAAQEAVEKLTKVMNSLRPQTQNTCAEREA